MGVSMSSTSLAHTYGNVTSFVVEYLKNLLPNYFKTVHVTSTIAYRQLGRLNLNKSPGVFKKSKPILIVAPNIEMDTDDLFLGGTWLTSRLTDQYLDHDYTNLQPFIRDENSGFEIKYLLNRLKVNYNITILCETQMEQLNIAHFIKNKVRQNRPFFVETFLESQIPRTMLDCLGNQSGHPMYDPSGSVSEFVHYLNGISRYPITYKMKTSTGNDEFFRYYPTNLLMSIRDLSIDDGTKKGQTFDYFTITFQVPVEFNTAGLYYLFHDDEKVHIYIKQQQDADFEKYAEKVVMNPVFTIHNLFNVPLPEGWSMYGTSIFKVVKEEGEVDEVDLTCLHNQSMVEFIKECNEKGIPIDPFIKVYLMKNNEMLVEGEGKDYVLSKDTTKIDLYNLDPDSSYRVIIHANTNFINETMRDRHNLDD